MLFYFAPKHLTPILIVILVLSNETATKIIVEKCVFIVEKCGGKIVYCVLGIMLSINRHKMNKVAGMLGNNPHIVA